MIELTEKERIKEELGYLRDNLYNNVPSGHLDAFSLATLISQHLKDLDRIIDNL